jgi:GTPase SAR1 family protein
MWMAELKQNNPAVPVILVGFKADLSPSDRTVTAEEAEAKASSLNVPYLEASSKTGINLKRAYNILLRKAWKDRIAAAKTAPPPVTQNQINPPPSVFETLWRKVTGYFSS